MGYGFKNKEVSISVAANQFSSTISVEITDDLALSQLIGPLA